ncbi:MAG: 30S ribosomal protein S17 [Acidimicrobiales bacterium]
MSDATTPETEVSANPTIDAEGSAASTTPTGLAGSSASEDTARENPRKVREGIVVSTSMEKTAVVEAIDRVRHRRYAKTVQRSSKLFAHDENNDANVGDRVRIQETRPLSKKKRWRLVEIVERAR